MQAERTYVVVAEEERSGWKKMGRIKQDFREIAAVSRAAAETVIIDLQRELQQMKRVR